MVPRAITIVLTATNHRQNTRKAEHVMIDRTWGGDDILHMVLKYLRTTSHIRQWDRNMPIETARTNKSTDSARVINPVTTAARGYSRVKTIREVGRSDDYQAFIL